VWLDAERTSPFRFYQFWLNTDDKDVIRYLKFFTFTMARRDRRAREGDRAHPERRDAQRALPAPSPRSSTATSISSVRSGPPGALLGRSPARRSRTC
jgi:hypothetical protein